MDKEVKDFMEGKSWKTGKGYITWRDGLAVSIDRDIEVTDKDGSLRVFVENPKLVSISFYSEYGEDDKVKGFKRLLKKMREEEIVELWATDTEEEENGELYSKYFRGILRYLRVDKESAEEPLIEIVYEKHGEGVVGNEKSNSPYIRDYRWIK